MATDSTTDLPAIRSLVEQLRDTLLPAMSAETDPHPCVNAAWHLTRALEHTAEALAASDRRTRCQPLWALTKSAGFAVDAAYRVLASDHNVLQLASLQDGATEYDEVEVTSARIAAELPDDSHAAVTVSVDPFAKVSWAAEPPHDLPAVDPLGQLLIVEGLRRIGEALTPHLADEFE